MEPISEQLHRASIAAHHLADTARTARWVVGADALHDAIYAVLVPLELAELDLADALDGYQENHPRDVAGLHAIRVAVQVARSLEPLLARHPLITSTDDLAFPARRLFAVVDAAYVCWTGQPVPKEA